eukprot:170632-Hanusia_phi.AAC.1
MIRSSLSLFIINCDNDTCWIPVLRSDHSSRPGLHPGPQAFPGLGKRADGANPGLIGPSGELRKGCEEGAAPEG